MSHFVGGLAKVVRIRINLVIGSFLVSSFKDFDTIWNYLPKHLILKSNVKLQQQQKLFKLEAKKTQFFMHFSNFFAASFPYKLIPGRYPVIPTPKLDPDPSC